MRHTLAVIHNNSDLLSMLQDIRTQKGLTAFSEIDIQNIKHISGDVNYRDKEINKI